MRMKIEEFKRFVSWLPEAVDKIFFGEYMDGAILVGKTNVKEPEARWDANIAIKISDVLIAVFAPQQDSEGGFRGLPEQNFSPLHSANLFRVFKR